MKRLLLLIVAGTTAFAHAPLAQEGPPAGGVGSFRPLANFNVPGATTAEIVSASADGRLLAYTDATGDKFGIVDITDPAAPQQLGTIPAGGQPTSVAALPFGNLAIGVVQPGRLLLLDLDARMVLAERAIGAGPDSIAVSVINGQLVAVVAIENEGALPKGYVEVIRINLLNFASSPGVEVRFDDEAALASAGLIAVTDPQPEYVAIRGTRAAVTLQENNGIAIIDLSAPAAPVLQALFSAGVVDDRAADLMDDARIAFNNSYPTDVAGRPDAGARIPDAIAWSRDGQALFTADEGEANYTGGRGWSARTAAGTLLFDDGGSLEATAVRYGFYPDGRSDAKGIEAEGILTASFGNREFIFVSSERGSFVAVYRLTAQNEVRFVQLLPTGIAPEGLLAIPSRNLFITSNEGDDEDGTISIFGGVSGPWRPSPNRPTIRSRGVEEPWGAVSGLTASLTAPELLFAVPDSALPSAIYSIEVGAPFAPLRVRTPVTRLGEQARYDLEGITVDTSIAAPRRNSGFWLASEGNASSTRNALVQVNARGEVLREIFLPASIDAPGGRITSNGFEGVAVSSDGRYLLVAVQRPFTGDQAVGGVAHTRIARYDLQLGVWQAFFYPLVTAPGTIGLSEIALIGRAGGQDVFAVIERDNRFAASANIKRLYQFALGGLTPVDIATPANAATLAGSTIVKTLLSDVLPLFAPYEKVEGLTRTLTGDLWVALDNDGGEVESRLVRLGEREEGEGGPDGQE